MTTEPFKLAGGTVTANIDATKGLLMAELLDAETMQPLPGLSTADCEPVRGDHISASVTWRGSPESSIENAVRARFTLKNAKLYAFWVSR